MVQSLVLFFFFYQNDVGFRCEPLPCSLLVLRSTLTPLRPPAPPLLLLVRGRGQATELPAASGVVSENAPMHHNRGGNVIQKKTGLIIVGNNVFLIETTV